MKKFLNVFKQKNMMVGYLYAYIHFVTEIVCFYTLSRIISNSVVLFMSFFIYDMVAFVPQGIIGHISDKYPKINMGLIGTLLLTVGFMGMSFNMLIDTYLFLVILCLGNACIHVEGAETTLRLSNGKLAHSAIFVSGGSFGVITGKLLAKYAVTPLVLTLLIATMIPCILVCKRYKLNGIDNGNDCENFDYGNKKISPALVIIFAVLIVIVRGYMGYGIPTSWNKTVIQTIMLYSFMGVGKALGGILTDAFGIRKTAILSVLGGLPFLIFGDNIMVVSLIGIMLFSMTMAITLGVLVSVLKKAPGVAFGLTTIGLFLGTVPVFFVKFSNVINAGVIVILSIICLIILLKILKKEGSNGRC